MTPRVYTSGRQEVPILNKSIFTHLFAGPSKPAFVDAATGTALTRAELLNLTLCFAHGLHAHQATAAIAKVGATALIYSPNSLAWPVGGK
ncbi:hypothetical protein C8R44DRAFT_893888 [Mycena epipterygia]|nr:hypothetical protein C8R44DRAFT_893888 [Mycena epipterygia]